MFKRQLTPDQKRNLQGYKQQFLNDSSIAANAEWFKSLEFVAGLKNYLPADNVVVSNNSAEPIDFYPNDDPRFKKRIFPNTIQAFTKSTVGGLISFRAVNVGTNTISANEIEIYVEKEKPNTQSVVDILAKKFPHLFT